MGKVLDLFCGAGGLSYGFEKVGLSIIAGIDHNKSSLETFKNNHTDAMVIEADLFSYKPEDILDKNSIKMADIIIGGPPCQGLSLSGPRREHDPRNKLFLAYIDFIKLIQPKLILLENVPGLVSLFNGKVRNEIINEFSRLGYLVEYKILNSADYGVPQTRKRVIFIGYKGKKNNFVFPEPTHFSTDNVNKYISCSEALSDLPSLEKDMGAFEQEYLTLPVSEYQKEIRKNSKKLFNHVGTQHAEHVINTIKLVPEGGNYKDLPSSYISTRKFNVAWTRFHSKKPAPTIDTGHRHHFHYTYNRVPTVRECARLQSFPDNFIFYGNKTDQYRQVGNAVPPIMAEAIAKRMVECL